ncbi:Ribosome biogenesis protein erb1 [Thelohanellus kitauei]|uniref:Ribosome biogenesis protein erb1 n=1 Tax=Thelohanellus kitauei TaxID=669202 RepID=A0A0C2JHG2_THEKT|nr:Ribosome biogenesis protein erb1 [Thelohanellus kitauei]
MPDRSRSLTIFNHDGSRKKILYQIDEFLFQNDENGGISVFNPDTRAYDVLNDEEIELVERLKKGTFADANYDPYPEYIDYFTGEVMKLPLSCAPEPKRRFLPSAHEYRKVICD